jgi:type VI secretion system protein ImpA
MSEIEQLLQPLAGADPCGADPEADSRIEALRGAIESGGLESAADWKKVRQQVLDLLNDGRSVELLVYLTVALTATDGYRGLRDGLEVLARSLEDYWDTIHPKPDPSEPEEERYIIRLNTLAQLGEAPRKPGDPFGFVEKILRAPLNVANRGPHSFWPVWEEQHGGEAVAEAATVRDAVQRLELGDREVLAAQVNGAIAALERLNGLLIQQTGGAYNAPFEEHLLPTLQSISRFLASSAGGVDREADRPLAQESVSEEAVSAGERVPVADMRIRSSADVRNAMDKIIEYYRRAEPSSPVPHLLIRAKKLVDADFMTIINNLNKDAEFQFRTALDITEESN